MKSIILVALALVAVAVAIPVDETPQILESNFDQTPEGGYNYRFKTEDGVVREEQGQVREAFDEDNKPHNVVVVRGSYSYPNAEGGQETISYTADENGFHPEGPSIPKVASR